MSESRLRVTVEDRETGQTHVFDAERVVQVIGMNHTDPSREMWVVGVHNLSGDESASACATLLDHVVELFGSDILEHIQLLRNRKPLAQKWLKQSITEPDADT